MFTRLLFYMIAGSFLPIPSYGQQGSNGRWQDNKEPQNTPQTVYQVRPQPDQISYQNERGVGQSRPVQVRLPHGADTNGLQYVFKVPVTYGLHNELFSQTPPTTSRASYLEGLRGQDSSHNNDAYLNNQGTLTQLSLQQPQVNQGHAALPPIQTNYNQAQNSQPIRGQQGEGRPLAVDQHAPTFSVDSASYGPHIPTNSDSTSQSGSQNTYKPNRVQPDRSGTYDGYDTQLPVGHPQQGPKPSQLALSTMKCGIQMMQHLGHERQGNTVISPLSIVIALSTLQQGANGETGRELTTFLQSDAASSRDRIRNFKTKSKIAPGGNILTIANGVFVNNAFTLNKEFKNVAVKDFWSDVFPLNFRQPSQAAGVINRWVSESTGNLIPTLVDSRSLDPSTQLMLTNAVFFKGIWNTTFPIERTRPMPFTAESGNTKPVPFMTQIGQFRAGDDSALNARWLFLPFLNEEFNMLFILPEKGLGLDRLIESLTEATLERILRDTNTREVIMKIPKFKLSFETDLINTLGQSGVQSIFNSFADLSGLGSSPNNDALYVSKVLHKATIEIDEQGSAAAAVTSLAVNTLSLSSYNDEFRFLANRPFLALLFDKNLSTPLFMAKIVDP